MRINDVEFNASLEQILDELISQMRLNNIPYIQKMKVAGDSIQISCPYHANGMERRPSAGLRKSDGKFHCFACGEIHELYEVISYCLGYENDVLGSFGWKWLLKNFATIQIEQRKPLELNLERRQQMNEEKKIIYVSEEELDHYRYYHPYWKERGIVDEHVIELFDLGFDAKTDCLTFPVRDIKGNTLFVARRSVKTKFFNYPKDVEKPLYGLYEYTRISSEISRGIMFMKDPPELLKSMNEVVITESMLDALSFWQAGKFAMALNGTGNELQMKQLRELPCRKLILATDNDKAGMKARQRIRENVKNKIITEYVFPEGRKDGNECSIEEIKNLQEIF